MSENLLNAPLRHVGVGAAGVVFPMHRDAIAANGGELVAICDTDIGAGQARAKKYGCAFFDDSGAMLRATKPDIAVVATPHPFHKTLAIEALQSGCHVLVEKPIAVSVEEADEMSDAARATQRILAVNFQQRLRPEILAARAVMDAGGIGDITRIDLVSIWNRTPAYYRSGGWRGTWRGEGGGILLNQAPHDLDLLCFLMGAPSRVLALTRTLFHDIEVEDSAQAILEWPQGALGSVHLSTAEAGVEWKLDFLGTRGLLQIRHGSATLHSFESDLRTAMAQTEATSVDPAMRSETLALAQGASNHRAVYRNFHAALRGEEALSCDAAGAIASLELANAMILSSYREKFVALPLDRGEVLALAAGVARLAVAG